MLAEKLSHQLRNLGAIRFQGEVPSIEQVELQCLQVSFVRFRTFTRKNLVIFAPNDQHRRLLLAEIFLPLRVQRWVTTVAQEQIELDFVVARSVEQKLVM